MGCLAQGHVIQEESRESNCQLSKWQTTLLLLSYKEDKVIFHLVCITVSLFPQSVTLSAAANTSTGITASMQPESQRI